ncbi:MAG: head GIN domain-containing protein [Candidatus Cyclobacteriaceae bacterium M3_2C_046]
MQIIFNRSELFYYLGLALLLLTCSCNLPEKGNGNIISQNRELPYFEEIDIQGNYEVVLHHHNNPGLIITTDQNLQQYIQTQVNDGRLRIRNTTSLKSTENIIVEIYFSNLKKISSAGASLVSNKDIIKSPALSIDFPGTGIINLEIETDHLQIDLSGAGLISLLGYASVQELDLTGAGNVNAYNLVSNEIKVKLDGMGAAELFVRQKLDAQINGIGNIKYRGNPTEVETEINGLGNIEHIESEENS